MTRDERSCPCTARTASSTSRRGLVARGFEILSTGGTAAELEKAGVTVTGVSKATGFPEILDGRVKTLHPRVHGGILARRDAPEHLAALEKHAIAPIDVVVVNLYPFEDKVAKGCSLRRGGREHRHRRPDAWCARRPRTSATWRSWSTPPTTGCSSSSSTARAGSTPRPGSTSRRRPSATPAATRRRSPATSPRSRCARAPTCPAETDETFPYRLNLTFEKVQDLRYGENPHQRAAFYSDLGSTLYSVAAARKMQGKELSFNNILDLDAAWRLVTELDEPACVIVKHTNPCGTGTGASPLEAYERAWACDPTSAFGGIIAFNEQVDAATARKVTGQFVEAVIAPGFETEALEVLGEEDEPARDEHGHDRASTR